MSEQTTETTPAAKPAAKPKLTDGLPSGLRIRNRANLRRIPRKLAPDALKGRKVYIARTFLNDDGKEYNPGDEVPKTLLAHEFLGGYFRRGYLVSDPPLDTQRKHREVMPGTRAERIATYNSGILEKVAKAVDVDAGKFLEYLKGHPAADINGDGYLDKAELRTAAIALKSGAAKRRKPSSPAESTPEVPAASDGLSRNNTKAEIVAALEGMGIDVPANASKGELLALAAGAEE